MWRKRRLWLWHGRRRRTCQPKERSIITKQMVCTTRNKSRRLILPLPFQPLYWHWWLASRQKEKNQRVHTSLLVAYAPFLPTTSHSSSWPFCCKHPEGSQVRLAKRPPCDDDTLSPTPPKSRKCKATENTKLESNKYKIKERWDNQETTEVHHNTLVNKYMHTWQPTEVC